MFERAHVRDGGAVVRRGRTAHDVGGARGPWACAEAALGAHGAEAGAVANREGRRPDRAGGAGGWTAAGQLSEAVTSVVLL